MRFLPLALPIIMIAGEAAAQNPLCSFILEHMDASADVVRAGPEFHKASLEQLVKTGENSAQLEAALETFDASVKRLMDVTVANFALIQSECPPPG
jgi:hypothetical protein